jgi:hypothetical protein
VFSARFPGCVWGATRAEHTRESVKKAIHRTHNAPTIHYHEETIIIIIAYKRQSRHHV